LNKNYAKHHLSFKRNFGKEANSLSCLFCFVTPLNSILPTILDNVHGMAEVTFLGRATKFKGAKSNFCLLSFLN